MATILGLAMKISADATGVQKSLTPVERALNGLQEQVDKSTSAFKPFTQASAAAAEAQKKSAADFAALTEQLKAGLDFQEYAKRFKDLQDATAATAAAFAEGARITEQYRTEEEKLAVELERIARLEEQGAITAQTAARARADATGETAAAAAAEKERAAAAELLARQSEAITARYLTDAEKRAAIEADLNEKRAAGAISEETYKRAIDDVTGATAAAAKAEADRAAQLEEGRRLTAQFQTAEENRAAELERIDGLLRAGAITEDIAARARAEASGANAEAARIERERADAVADAARIIRANLTPQERYDQQIQELNVHLREGRLSQDQFNRAAAQAKQDLDRAGKAAGDADKNIERLNRNVSLLTKLEIGRAIVDGLQVLSRVFTSTASQITSLVTSVNSSLDTLNDFSARTGIGAEALQGYSLAAKLAGVDTEAFGMAVQRLGVNIGKAAPGDALDKSLRGINLSVAELRALSPEQQFSAIGNAIAQLPTAADRAAASVAVFGKQGAALAPLFREGAASIEELKARAERLGAIVDQTQINNVASMNDAFDLVSATVQGIIGQVIGNLAPAVTDVTNQFLKFVEEWAGAQGKGGTGIANAITDVLLQGAEYFAGIFDKFIGSFTGFGVTLKSTGDAFTRVAGVLEALSGTFKAIFNTFEIIGNGIAVALGKVLEAIGSYVSSDLEAFGQNLQVNASERLQQNLTELEQAGQQIINGVTDAVFGNEQEQQAAAAGAAQTYIQELRAKIEQERAPAFKIQTNIEETRDRFESFFNGIVDQSSVITDAMRQFEAVVASVEDPLNMTEEEINRIKTAQENVNRLIDQEIANRQDARDAAMKQADEDGKRVEALLKTSSEATKIQEDLDAVYREASRVQQELTAAREQGLQKEADAAAARLGQLDQLQAKLEDQQQAVEQGFGEGFTKAFEQTTKGIDSLIVKAEQFGNVGALAAQALQAGIEQAQQQVRDGILTKETYDREVARQQDLFNQRLAAAQRVEDYLMTRMDDRQRAELDATKQLEERKKQAAVNVQAIEAKIIDEQKKLEEARGNNRLKDAKAAQARIDDLKRVQRAEQGIVDGRVQADRAQNGQLVSGFNRTQQFQSLIAQQNENFLKSFNNAYAGANASLQAANAAAAELLRQEELRRPTTALAQTADIRTQQGQDLVLQLAQNAQDPALIEAKLQTKQLQLIAQGIGQAASNYFNAPVSIVGGAFIG